MNKQILALTLLALGALHFGTQNKATIDQSIETKFNAWKLQYNVEYDTQEEHNYRLAAFAETEKFIVENTNEIVQHAHNQFSHFTKEEFKALMLGWQSPKAQANDLCTEIGPILCSGDDCESCLNEYTSMGLLDCTAADIQAVCGTGPTPPPVNITNIDWRTSSSVQKVKDQGQCGSCWAFSTIASTESAAKIIGGGALGDYSEQQLVDCSGSYGNQGCNGGLMDYGFAYIKDHGICTESGYGPYTAADGSCKATACTATGTVSAFTDVSAGSVDGLSSALAQQVVSVAVDAESGWQTYSGGILSSCGTSLDHGVTLVGQDSGDGSGSYLIVKNSWGASWGENGYIRLAYGNTCGIANSASYPTP